MVWQLIHVNSGYIINHYLTFVELLDIFSSEITSFSHFLLLHNVFSIATLNYSVAIKSQTECCGNAKISANTPSLYLLKTNASLGSVGHFSHTCKGKYKSVYVYSLDSLCINTY